MVLTAIEPGIRVSFSTDDERWEATKRRDSAADEIFWYGVSSTGVYCRPSCAARLPLRKNVSFYDSRAAAEVSGFRPCKRCHPHEQALREQQAAAIESACRTIEHSDEMLRLDDLAATTGLSRFHFHRLFKTQTGLTPRAYADASRARRLREQLEGGAKVTDAMYESGFNSSSRFYAGTADLLGMTPTAFRTGGRGTSVHFAVGQCSLGAVLVAATEKGVCAIALGDDPEILVHGLEDRFPNATLEGADGRFAGLVATVIGFVDEPSRGIGLPLDIRGSAFQRRVWQALQAVPAGSTVSYAEIARRIGQPGAARPVARACATNPLAVAIPCHRVVRNDGLLGGYRWGVERKRALLEREAVPA